MSKTYTFSAMTLRGFRKTGASSVLNYTLAYSPAKVGHSGDYYHAISIVPTAAQAEDWAHCYGLPSSAITSVTLTLTHASGYACPGKAGCLATDGTATSKCSGTMINCPTTASSTSTVKDITSLGVPQYGYGVGAAATTSNTVNVNITAAKIVIVTAESTYKLSYSANGGEGAPAAQSGVGIGEYTFTVSNTVPTRTGYTFLGWSLSSSATTASYHGGDSITITANKTLYAVWDKIKYAMTHNPGASGTGTTVVIYKEYGLNSNFATKAMTNFTRTGHDYDGWSDSDGGAKVYDLGQLYTANAPITVYAHWFPCTYTVSFDAHGGSDCDSITVTYGSAYGTLPTTTRNGYTFGGWFTAETGGTQVTDATTVTATADHTLHAHWTANTYTVTYTDEEQTQTQTITTDVPWTVNAYCYTKTGHTQTSWNTEADGSGTTYTAGQIVSAWSTMTLHAIFTANQYTVSFDAHGGTEVPSKTVTYGSPYGALVSPVRARYSFDGWFTAESGGTHITAETVVSQTANHTLHAHWTLLETTHYYRCNVFVKTPNGCKPATIGNMLSGAYRPGQTYYRYTEE